MARPETRDRLVCAARDLFYHNGYLHTSLADVAQVAGVPAGNIYYHFKSKDSLLEAVILGYMQEVTAAGVRAQQNGDPRARLRAFFALDAETAEQVARYGCPYGTLCQELEKL